MVTEPQGVDFAVEALMKMCGGPGGATGESTEVRTCSVVLVFLLFCGCLFVCFSLSTM